MKIVCLKLALYLLLLTMLPQIVIRLVVRRETPTTTSYIAYASAEGCDPTDTQECSPGIVIVEPYHDKALSFSTPSWVRTSGGMSWSYDYRYLAYSDGLDINVYDMKTGESRNLTQNRDKPFEIAPKWSPTSYTLAFASYTDPVDYWRTSHFTVFDLTQRSGREIVSHLSVRWWSWSPDGSQILLSGSVDAEAPPDLYRVKPDGTELKQLTYTDFGDYSPDWSRDGKNIIFVGLYDSSTTDGSDVYMMDADGASLTQLTFNGIVNTMSPTWVLGDTSIFYGTAPYDITTLHLLDLNSRIDIQFLQIKNQTIRIVTDVSPDRTQLSFVTFDFNSDVKDSSITTTFDEDLCLIEFGDKTPECFKINAYPTWFPTWGR